MRKAETGEEREERRRERREEARPPSRTVEEEKELKNSSPPSFCGLSRQKESLLMASIADKNDSLSAERGRKRTGTRGCDEREKHIQERGRSIFGKMCFCTPFGVPLRKSFDPLSFSLSSFFLHSYKKKQVYSELNKAQKRKVNGYRLAEFRKTQGVGKASSKKK